MDEKALLERITYNPQIFGGKPIVRGHRLAVEHILEMLAAGDTTETVLALRRRPDCDPILALPEIQPLVVVAPPAPAGS